MTVTDESWMEEVDQAYAEWLADNVADAVITEDDQEVDVITP